MISREKFTPHSTPHPAILGYIDTEERDYIKGWLFNYDEISIISKDKLKIMINGTSIEHYSYYICRNDVSEFYGDNNYKIANCGFLIPLLNSHAFETFEFQYWDEDTWITLFNIGKPPLKINDTIPQFLVVDNFYQNPDEVRKYALKQEFVTNIASHKGNRTVKDFNNDEIKQQFEKLIGKKITKWDYKWNGCFQYCVAQDPLVIHCDVQKYAAIIYLTPDAPCSTGTSFYRHKQLKCQYYKDSAFQGGNYDFTPFEMVDSVGNVYNRLIIFDAKLIHSASQYFGTACDNGRLFQIFFFDVDT